MVVFTLLFALCLTFFASFANAATINLSWGLSGTAGVTGYRIYYGTATGVYGANLDAGLSATGSIGSLTPGTTYYIAVKAYTATGQESAFSNEVVQLITIDPPDPDAPLIVTIVPQVINR